MWHWTHATRYELIRAALWMHGPSTVLSSVVHCHFLESYSSQSWNLVQVYFFCSKTVQNVYIPVTSLKGQSHRAVKKGLKIAFWPFFFFLIKYYCQRRTQTWCRDKVKGHKRLADMWNMPVMETVSFYQRCSKLFDQIWDRGGWWDVIKHTNLVDPLWSREVDKCILKKPHKFWKKRGFRRYKGQPFPYMKTNTSVTCWKGQVTKVRLIVI